MKEIEKIIEAYDATDWKNTRAALGTVVKVEGSAFRRVGARLFVTSEGQWTGGISGGCLEGDALKRAQMAMNSNRSSKVVYDTLEEDSHQIGVGLGCNGRIEVMFTPIDPWDERNPIELLRAMRDSRRVEVLLQILSSSARDSGLQGYFTSLDKRGELAGMLQLPAEAIETSVEAAREKDRSSVVTLSNEAGERFELLVELVRPKIKLICAGDNYDVEAIVQIAHELHWEVHVAGKLRKLSRRVFDLSRSARPYDGIDGIPVDAHTAVVLMSHDYQTDLALLKHFIHQDVSYIGLLGPKTRMRKLRDELLAADDNIDLYDLPNLYAPTGLDIGAAQPEEIALSIVAEIIAVLRGRSGGFLRERPGPIYDRA